METLSGAGAEDSAATSKQFKIYLSVFLVAVVVAITVALFDPDNSKFLNLEEYSPLQNLQAAVLGLALLINIVSIFQSKGEARAFWIFILAVSFFYFWREMDLDKEFVGARMFSWKYLGQSEAKLPFTSKLALAIPSFAIVLFWGGHLVFKFKTIYKATWDRIQPRIVFWGAIHFTLFFTAQLWDKATMIRRHIKFNVHAMAHKDPYAEEAMELLGELAFLFFILSLRTLLPKEPKVAWAKAQTWLQSTSGIKVIRIFGAVVLAAGLGLVAFGMKDTFTVSPSEYEHIFTVDYRSGLRETALEYLGLSRGQVILLAMILGLGGMVSGVGIGLLRRKLSRLGMGGILLLMLALGTIPFLVLTPSPNRNMKIRIVFSEKLSSEQVTALSARLTPERALASLPEACQKKLHLGSKNGFDRWELKALDEGNGEVGVQCAYTFVDGLRTRQRSTVSEFYMHAMEAMSLEAAKEQGMGLKVFKSKDFDPYLVQHTTMAEGDWHRWRRKWIKGLRGK